MALKLNSLKEACYKHRRFTSPESGSQRTPTPHFNPPRILRWSKAQAESESDSRDAKRNSTSMTTNKKLQWESFENSYIRPQGSSRRLKSFPKPIANFNVSANWALVTGVQEMFETEEVVRNLSDPRYDPFADIEPMGGLMKANVSQIGPTTRPPGIGLSVGDIVLYANRRMEKKEYFVRQGEDIVAFLEEKDVLGTIPNISCGLECLEEVEPHQGRLLVRPKLKPHRFHAMDPFVRGNDQVLWCTVEKPCKMLGDEEYILHPGDEILVPRGAVVLLNPTDRGRPLGVVPKATILGYRFHTDKFLHAKPNGDTIVVEYIPQLLPQIDDPLRGRAPIQFAVGRVLQLGSGTHPLAAPEIPLYNHKSKLYSYVLFDVAGSKRVEWPRVSAKYALPNRRRLVIREDRIRAVLPPKSRGLLPPDMKELEPAVGWMLAELDAIDLGGMEGSIPPLPLKQNQLRRGVILKRGPPSPNRRPARPPAAKWVHAWKKRLDLDSDDQPKPQLESAQQWIENWKMKVKMNLSDDVVSARQWIERWKLRLTPDLYRGTKEGDTILAYFFPSRRRFSASVPESLLSFSEEQQHPGELDRNKMEENRGKLFAFINADNVMATLK
eukprot:jgi/Bigna1/77966/fgenesh1_pg.51_\